MPRSPNIAAGRPRGPNRRTARRCVSIAVAIAGAFAPAAGRSQAPTGSRLTLADAVQRAVRQYPGVGAARASSDQARAALAGAAAARFPSIALAAGATQYEQPMLVTPIHGLAADQAPPFDETLVQGAALLQYTLFDGGARGARIRSARERSAAADASAEGAEQALMARTATAFVQVQARKQVVDAHDRRLAALDAEVERAGQLFEVGRVAQVEVLRAKAALASARAERVRFAVALDLAERELARLTGARNDETCAECLVPVRLADSLLAPRTALLDAALDNSPAVAQARRQVAARDADVTAAQGARWPELTLNAGYVQRGSAATRSWGEWSTGMSLSLPLFTGGAVDAGVAQARAARRAATEELRLVELDVAQSVDRARSAVEEAHAREQSLAMAAASFAEVARMQRLALDAGTGTQIDYLSAEADLLAAQASYAEAAMTGLAARVELARVTGQLSLPWLQRALEVTP